MSETRELISKSRKVGIKLEKLFQSTTNLKDTLNMLNTYNLIETNKFHTARNNIDAPLDSQMGNKVLNLKGIKNIIQSKTNIEVRVKGLKNKDIQEKKKEAIWSFCLLKFDNHSKK